MVFGDLCVYIKCQGILTHRSFCWFYHAQAHDFVSTVSCNWITLKVLSDRKVCANYIDFDQTAPLAAVWSNTRVYTVCRSFCIFLTHYYMDRVKRIWYLSPMRAAKVQASLRIRTVSPEPPLLAHTGSRSRETFRQKASSLARMAGHAQLKFVMSECSKTQIRLTWLIW